MAKSKKVTPPKIQHTAALEAEKIAAVEEGPNEAEGAKPENWADQPDSDVYKAASKLYDKIQRCYDNKQDQIDNIEEYWNIFGAKPDENQQYTGNTQCYIPIVRDCIRARTKRSLAQLFPANHKHVEIMGPTGESTKPQVALLEHYIRKTKLKELIRADLIAGDVTGQWNLYVDWTKSYRTIKEIVKKPPSASDGDLEIEDATAEPEQKVEERDIITEGPDIVPFATEDFVVYPPTCNDIEKSTASSIKLRMSKEKVQQMLDDGIFVGESDAEALIERIANPQGKDRKVPEKKRVQDAGIKTDGTYKYALIYEVACNLPLDGLDKPARPALVYFASEHCIVGIIRSPWWSGRRPTLSAATEEVTGSFFGKSLIEAVKFLQWNINDFWNMGMDSGQYALLPITMVDPAKNPQYQSMVMGLAAIWLTDPNSTKFANFPPLWKDAMSIVTGIKAQIMESLDVTEAMLGKTPQGRKNNQMVGNMQQEQQINITDHAKRYEEVILNPLVERMMELDQQFRTESITVFTRGENGARAVAEVIEPQSFGITYEFRWMGTAYQQNMQRLQQMIATMNVLRGVPPEQLNGRRLDICPILEVLIEQTFGPELGPRILIDDRNQFTIPAQLENEMMSNGICLEIHPADDHAKHLQEHNAAAMLTTDPAGVIRTHMQLHLKAMQQKMQAQLGAMQPGGAQGMPGGGPPGVAGSPKPGAQPGQPRMQGPNGSVHPDQMLGAPGRG
jgi:hypothetical protein